MIFFWNFLIQKCAQFLSDLLIIFVGLTVTLFSDKIPCNYVVWCPTCTKKSWMVSNEDEACFRLLMIDSIFVTRTYIQVTQVFGILVTHGCRRHLCPTQLSQILFKIAWLLIFANSIQGKTKWRDCRLNIKTHIGLKWIWKVFLQYIHSLVKAKLGY